MSDDDQWISTQAAAVLLRITPRQVQRYAQNERIRSRRVGNRLQVHQEDVRALSDELGSQNRQPIPQVVPADVLLGYVNELRLELQAKEYMLGQMESRPLLQDHVAVQYERDILREQVAELQEQVKELQVKIKPSFWSRFQRKK